MEQAIERCGTKAGNNPLPNREKLAARSAANVAEISSASIHPRAGISTGPRGQRGWGFSPTAIKVSAAQDSDAMDMGAIDQGRAMISRTKQKREIECGRVRSGSDMRLDFPQKTSNGRRSRAHARAITSVEVWRTLDSELAWKFGDGWVCSERDKQTSSVRDYT